MENDSINISTTENVSVAGYSNQRMSYTKEELKHAVSQYRKTLLFCNAKPETVERNESIINDFIDSLEQLAELNKYR